MFFYKRYKVPQTTARFSGFWCLVLVTGVVHVSGLTSCWPVLQCLSLKLFPQHLPNIKSDNNNNILILTHPLNNPPPPPVNKTKYFGHNFQLAIFEIMDPPINQLPLNNHTFFVLKKKRIITPAIILGNMVLLHIHFVCRLKIFQSKILWQSCLPGCFCL